MKNKTNLFLILIIFTLIFWAWKPSGTVGNGGGSQIAFTETEYDFGEMNPGDEAVHYFVYSNTGDAPLVILNVRASCGCMASEWTKKPVEAGTKDSIRVEYNTKIKGAFSKTITVQSNAVSASVDLKIRGNVIKSR
jgi:hypothetical protein